MRSGGAKVPAEIVVSASTTPDRTGKIGQVMATLCQAGFVATASAEVIEKFRSVSGRQ